LQGAARRRWSILSAPYEIRPPLTASERSEETVGKRWWTASVMIRSRKHRACALGITIKRP
jgi:hypothetical protein